MTTEPIEEPKDFDPNSIKIDPKIVDKVKRERESVLPEGQATPYVTPAEQERIKRWSNEQLVWYRSMFKQYRDEAQTAVLHYGSRLAEIENQIRKRGRRLKAEGKAWDEEEIKRSLDKIWFLAKNQAKDIDDLLVRHALGKDLEEEDIDVVESAPFEPEKPPTIIIPD